MNKCCEKINMVCTLRWAGVILIAVCIISTILGVISGVDRGAGFTDALMIVVIGLANGVFQPLVLLGIAEGLARMNKA